jgi:hypothetical protein
VIMDKQPQLSVKNKTDLMPNNSSCQRWDTPNKLFCAKDSRSPNTACRPRPPASTVLPLPAAPMQHGVGKPAPHHAAPSHAATSAAAAGG